MRFFILSLLSVLLTQAVLRAQSPKEPTRSVCFYYAGFSGAGDEPDPQSKFLLLNGKERISFQLNANSFSKTFEYAGPLPVVLFRELRTEKGGKREDLGQLPFPGEWRGVLFIITRDLANPRFPFHFYPVEYWAPSMPEKSIRIQNLCPYALAAKVGPNQAAVGARSTADLAFPVDRPDILLRLAARRGDKWERILSTGIVRPAQDKLLLLVFPRPVGAPRVLVLQDMPAPPAESVALVLPGRNTGP